MAFKCNEQEVLFKIVNEFISPQFKQSYATGPATWYGLLTLMANKWPSYIAEEVHHNNEKTKINHFVENHALKC